MIAFRATVDRDALRAPTIRPKLHDALPAAAELDYAPALSFPKHATAQQVIDALRMMRPGDESVYYLFVTGEEDRLVGVVSLRQVVTAQPETRLETIMSREVVSLPASLGPEQQAHILGQSGFIALPVVDGSGRLVGSLDATALLGAVEGKATEDMYRLACVARCEDAERPLGRAARDRIVWLAMTTLAAFLVGAVISGFQGLIAQAAILAAFLPVVVGPGSRAGAQTLTIAVRSLALGELALRNAGKTVLREVQIGLCNGLCIGLLAGLIGFVWQGSPAIGVIVGLAVLANLIIAALAGLVVPLALKAMRCSPALASSLVVTTATDLCGVASLLSLGTLALQLGYL
jgi:magnesium transporter